MAAAAARAKSAGIVTLAGAAQASYKAVINYFERDAELRDVREGGRERERERERWGEREGEGAALERLLLFAAYSSPLLLLPIARHDLPLGERPPPQPLISLLLFSFHISLATSTHTYTHAQQGTGVAIYFPPARADFDPAYARLAAALPADLGDWERFLGALYTAGEAIAAGAISAGGGDGAAA